MVYFVRTSDKQWRVKAEVASSDPVRAEVVINMSPGNYTFYNFNFSLSV